MRVVSGETSQLREIRRLFRLCLVFFNDTATTEIYTLSLHDALPICVAGRNRGLALEFLINACQNSQQRALAGSVQSDHADFGAVKIGQVNVLEDSFLVVI